MAEGTPSEHVAQFTEFARADTIAVERLAGGLVKMSVGEEVV